MALSSRHLPPWPWRCPPADGQPAVDVLRSVPKNAMVLDVDVANLADWLVREGGDRLWTVDGEPEIAGTLRLPCEASALAELLKKLGGRLRVFGPQDSLDLGSGNLGDLADTEDGGVVLEVAWMADSEPGEHWLLVEDTLAEEAQQATHVATETLAQECRIDSDAQDRLMGHRPKSTRALAYQANQLTYLSSEISKLPSMLAADHSANDGEAAPLEAGRREETVSAANI